MAVEAPSKTSIGARRAPVELAEEALRIAESEPLKAVELALEAVRLLSPSTFELESLERALRAHKARIRLEEESLRQAVGELKHDLGELLELTRRSAQRGSGLRQAKV